MNEKDDRYVLLRLSSQLCFPLYACSKEITRTYKPFLDKIDLTYTQYIVMMVLWEVRTLNVKALGERLFLDSGTLTPVLKKLENKGYLTRERSTRDERNLEITITEKGEELQEEALSVPEHMGACMNLPEAEMKELYRLLYKLLENVRKA